MRVLLAFLLVVTVGSMWEWRTNRVPRALPMLALCAFVSILLFSVSRLV
jgi:hypothetical protein